MWYVPPWIHVARYKEDRLERTFTINTARGYFSLLNRHHGERTNEQDRIVFQINYPLLMAQTVVVVLFASTALVVVSRKSAAAVPIGGG